MNRRDTFFALLALGAAPLAAQAQQAGKMRRIGVLLGYVETNLRVQSGLAAFKESLATLGWVEGRELAIDVRWTSGSVERAAEFAKELVALKPDVILASTTPATAAIQRETRAIPVVFSIVSDPVGSGFVKSLANPGGNITGLINLEASLAEKWLQLLKEIAPRMTQVAVMFNPKTAPYAEYYLQPLRAAAPKLRVKATTAPVGSESDIERTISNLGRERTSGLILMTDSFMAVHDKSIIALAARHKVPTMYWGTSQVEFGGLIGYGVDTVDLIRRAAPYVDRILRGTKPSELPVQQPTTFELAINLKAATGLGLKIPQSLLIRADRVIE